MGLLYNPKWGFFLSVCLSSIYAVTVWLGVSLFTTLGFWLRAFGFERFEGLFGFADS